LRKDFISVQSDIIIQDSERRHDTLLKLQFERFLLRGIELDGSIRTIERETKILVGFGRKWSLKMKVIFLQRSNHFILHSHSINQALNFSKDFDQMFLSYLS
jgi:hypothetical protein